MPPRSYPATPSLLKRLNTGRILSRILEGGVISRADLARQGDISPATVSALIAELIEQGIVVEVGRGNSARGRKPILIQLNPDGAAIVVASVRPDHFVVAVSDLGSNLRHLRVEEYPADTPPEGTVQALAEALVRTLAELQSQSTRVLGVGVSQVGMLRPHDDSVILSPNQPRWREVRLGQALRERLGTPVYVENDARAIALAETIYGRGSKYRHLVCITVAEGLGSGVIIDGDVYSGKSGLAGELGHTVVDPDGRACGCGKRGCLEAMASERALLRAVRGRLHRGAVSTSVREESLTPAAVLEAVACGDPIATAAADEIGHYLGVGLANAANTFEPEALALHGRIFSCERIMNRALEVLRQQALPASLESLDVWVSDMGEEATLKGAAAQVLRRRLLAPRL